MKPTIYRIIHLWPNKQPGHGLTAQIEEDRGRTRTIYVCPAHPDAVRTVDSPPPGERPYCPYAMPDTGAHKMRAIEVVPAPDRSTTVQIKPTDEPNALPSRFVSLQDYERLEREKR